MLPKSQRLNSSEVETVMSQGRALFGDLFLVKFIKNETGGLKISAIAPKKTFKTAVERNKVKRRINSALSPIFNKNFIKNSFLVAIVANKKSLSVKIPELSSSLEQIFVKGGIL
ncbi:MAG: ribonuclease P protein component [bacterium]